MLALPALVRGTGRLPRLGGLIVPAQNKRYVPGDVNLYSLRLLSTPGGDAGDLAMNCSHDATRATGAEGQAEGVRGPGVPFRSAGRARASLDPPRPPFQTEFPQRKGDR